jgi:hypothetical protein
MLITVLHNGREITGRVIYNFNTITDVILVQFEYMLANKYRNLLLFWDENAKTWCDGCGISDHLPEVYEQLTDKLRNVFVEASRLHSTK